MRAVTPARPNLLVAGIRRNRRLRRLVYRLGRARARVIVDWIAPCLEGAPRIVDIGAGTGNVTEVLRQRRWDVTPLDIGDLTFVDGMVPMLYDGGTIPFAPDSFDVALISTVLHHVRDQTAILAEAARVAPRLVVVEDVYDGLASRYFTWAMDSLLTLEFLGHPHSNRTDAEWRAVFAEMGLELRAAKYRRSFGLLKHAVYCLRRRDRAASAAEEEIDHDGQDQRDDQHGRDRDEDAAALTADVDVAGQTSQGQPDAEHRQQADGGDQQPDHQQDAADLGRHG